MGGVARAAAGTVRPRRRHPGDAVRAAGDAWATRGGRCGCTPRPPRAASASTVACPRRTRTCGRCPGSATTRPPRCWPSPTAAARWSWTPTCGGSSPASSTPRSTPRPSVTAAERDRAAAVLPDDDATAAEWSVALMEPRALVCTATLSVWCGACPLAGSCAWLAAGRPAYDGPAWPVQRFAGTDRQVRGLPLGVLCEAHGARGAAGARRGVGRRRPARAGARRPRGRRPRRPPARRPLRPARRALVVPRRRRRRTVGTRRRSP